MKCPFRMKAFDQPDCCDTRCAWLIDDTCAITVIALEMQREISDCSISFNKSNDKTPLQIERVIKQKGLSQAKLARMCDVSESSMSRIVRGVEPPYPKRGKRIADVLGWKDDWQTLFYKIQDGEENS